MAKVIIVMQPFGKIIEVQEVLVTKAFNTGNIFVCGTRNTEGLRYHVVLKTNKKLDELRTVLQDLWLGFEERYQGAVKLFTSQICNADHQDYDNIAALVAKIYTMSGMYERVQRP